MKKPAIVTPPPLAFVAQVRHALALDDVALTPLAGDAGSRRYYRVQCAATGRHGSKQNTIAVADPSPSQRRRFVAVAAQFSRAGVTVPTVLAQGPGFLLLEDFGDTTYQRKLHTTPNAAGALYAAALDALVRLQQDTTAPAALPLYSDARLSAEMRLFDDWYCARHLARPLSPAASRVVAKARRWLSATMRALPAVAVHRDYHSRNLMVLTRPRTPGMVDFQDAVAGNPLYDVVSLLRDAYVDWPPQKQQRWLRRYWRHALDGGVALPDSYEQCWMHFNAAGAQRGLKVLGIFARLALRDGKPGYLADLPLVHRHVRAACAALPALAPLATVIDDHPPV